MTRQIKKDSTNVSVEIYIVDDTDGTPETGVVFNTAGIDLNYRRDVAAVVSITEADLPTPILTDAHADGGFLHVANGRYRFDIPDAAFATGVSQVTIGGVVTGMVVLPVTIQLVDFDPDDATRMGLTALPNAVAEAAGGLYTRGTGAGQINQDANGRLDSNLAAVSQDSVAADNLELMFDGSGYTDTTAPASRGQVDGIGAASGGSLNFANEADNVDAPIKSISFDGVETSGTNASVNAEAGTYHQIDDTANNIDIVYRFDVGGGRTASEVIWKGRLVGTNDTMLVKVYNGATWDTVSSIDGQSNSAPTSPADNSTHNIPLLSTHTGTGSDLGKVFIRLECVSQSNPTIYTDQLLVEAVNIGQSIGYAGGQIWVDTVNGTAGTEPFVNGVADNPVLTWADALTLSASIGPTDFHIINGSTIQLTANSDNFSLFGDNWTLDLNGQSVVGIHIAGADVSGIASGTGTTQSFDDCTFGSTSHINNTHLNRCGLAAGTQTMLVPGDFFLHQCHMDAPAGSIPVIDFGAAIGSVDVHNHDWRGRIEFQNMGQLGTDALHIDGQGLVTFNANCVGGTVNWRGAFEIVNNGSGLTINDDARYDQAQILQAMTTDDTKFQGADVAAILVDTNELQTDDVPGLIAALNDLSSANVIAALEDAGQILVQTTIATLATQVSFTLSAGSVDNGAYEGAFAVIEDATTAAQKAVGLIQTYTGGTKTVLLRGDPGIFTMAVGDKISIIPVTTALPNGKAGSNFGLPVAGIQIPFAPADAAGGLPISDAGGLDLDSKLANTNEITVARMAALTDWIDGGRLDLLLDAIPTTAMRGTDSASTHNAAAVWTTALTEAYRATGATGTAAQLLYEILAHLGEFAIASTTKTTKKLDGTATAKTYTLDDDVSPTSITETT